MLTLNDATPDDVVRLSADDLRARGDTAAAAALARGGDVGLRRSAHTFAEHALARARLDRGAQRGELPPSAAVATARHADVARWPFAGDIPWDAAVGAFANTSHVPEQRAARIVWEYAAHMLKMQPVLGDDFEDYRRGYRERFLSWLRSRAGVASSMIAGPANFNVRQAQKRGTAADNRWAEVTGYHEAYLRRRAREQRKADRQSGNVVDDLRREIAEMERLQEAMKAVNAEIRKIKVMPVSAEDRQRVGEQIAAKIGLRASTVIKALEPDFAGRVGFPSYATTNNLANIKRKRERLADEEAKAQRAQAGGEDYTRTVQTERGPVEVRYNREEDRLQLTFAKGVIDSALLKQAALHWTPSKGIHQRQLTDKAVYAIAYMLERAGAKLDPPLPYLAASLTARAPVVDAEGEGEAEGAELAAETMPVEPGREDAEEAGEEPAKQDSPLALQADRLGVPVGQITPDTFGGRISVRAGRLSASLTNAFDKYGELGVPLEIPLYARPEDPTPIQGVPQTQEREAFIRDAPGHPGWWELTVDPKAAHPGVYYFQPVIPADQEDFVQGYYRAFSGKRQMSDSELRRRSGSFIAGYQSGRRARKDEDKEKAAKNDAPEDDYRRNGAPALRVQTGRALGPDRAFGVDFDPPGDDGYTRARLSDGYGASWRVPTVSVRRWYEDLNAHLVDVPRGLDRRVDEVLDGRARFAGKGNDGLVWITPSGWAVKADTVVLYQPQNDGQRTPEQAARHLEHEADVHRALAGLPMVPPLDVVRTPGGRVLLIKPALDTAPVLDHTDLLAVEATVKAIHARGWTIADRVQVGRAPDGRLYLYDLGSARQADSKYDRDGDRDYLRLLWQDAGFKRPPDADDSARQAEFYTRMVLSRIAKGERPSDSTLKAWREYTTAHGANIIGSDFDAYMQFVDRMEAIEDRLRALPPG